MKITISPKAERQLRKINKIDQIVIIEKIRKVFRKNNFLQEKRLSGYKKVFRLRISKYRIIYKKTKKEIYIILIGHRKDIYKVLKRLL
ncbi:MAG: type II toxin-antitoxin system RelE/ParE family toxin [Patescibacteria group bacterium]|nr:type II toxin-antitoxin system RelE/ParE family toxin [Patescibacteria group bacterium]